MVREVEQQKYFGQVLPQDDLIKNELPLLSGTYDEGTTGLNHFNDYATSFVHWENVKEGVTFGRRPPTNVDNVEERLRFIEHKIKTHGLTPRLKKDRDIAQSLHSFLGKPSKTEREQDVYTTLLADFPAIFFVDQSGVYAHNTTWVSSGIEYEFSITRGVSPVDLPILLVPKDKILVHKKWQQNMVGWAWLKILIRMPLIGSITPVSI
jgi:hypothetical protein